MATQLRDRAEDPKILERASDLYAERPIEEEDIAELEALIRSEAERHGYAGMRVGAPAQQPEWLHRCAKLKSFGLRCGICELQGIAR